MRTYAIVAALLVSFMAAFALGLLFSAQEGSPQPVVLAGIDVRELEAVNIKLLVPDELAKVSAEQAREALNAGGNPFDLPVQQVELARLVQEGPDGPYRDNLVWVVVLGDGTSRQMHLPGSGVLDRGADRKPVSYTYSIAVVDALTGELIFTTFGPPNSGSARP